MIGDLTVGAVQPAGRRPRGLDAGRGDRGGGGADARARTSDKPTGCSVLPPRGPCCKFNHPPPCYRDNLFAGPLPRKTWENKDAMARIVADRLANARRLGEQCVPICPPAADAAVALAGGVFGLASHDSAQIQTNDDAPVVAVAPPRPASPAPLLVEPVPSRPRPMVGFREPTLNLIMSGAKTFEARLYNDSGTRDLQIGDYFRGSSREHNLDVLVTSIETFGSFGEAWRKYGASLVPPAWADVTSESAANALYQSFYLYQLAPGRSRDRIRVFGVRPSAPHVPSS